MPRTIPPQCLDCFFHLFLAPPQKSRYPTSIWPCYPLKTFLNQRSNAPQLIRCVRFTSDVFYARYEKSPFEKFGLNRLRCASLRFV